MTMCCGFWASGFEGDERFGGCVRGWSEAADFSLRRLMKKRFSRALSV